MNNEQALRELLSKFETTLDSWLHTTLPLVNGKPHFLGDTWALKMLAIDRTLPVTPEDIIEDPFYVNPGDADLEAVVLAAQRYVVARDHDTYEDKAVKLLAKLKWGGKQ